MARATRLRAMKTGEIVDSALRTYQRLGVTFLRLTAGPALLCLAASAFVLNYVLPGLFTTRNASDFIYQIGEVFVALTLALFVGGPLFLIGLSYSTVIVVSLTSDDVLGDEPNVDAALKMAQQRLWTLFRLNMRELFASLSGVFIATIVMLIGAFIASRTAETDVTAGLVTLLGVLGLFAGFFVFLFFIGRDALAPAAVVLENASPVRAAARSRELQKNHPIQGSGSGPVLSVYTLLGFVSLVMLSGMYAIQGMLPINVDDFLGQLPFGPLWTEAYNLLPLFITLWTVMPIWASVVTVSYYDRRIRLEGFDIEVLAKEISHGRASRFDV
jgi:hypothetical protein